MGKLDQINTAVTIGKTIVDGALAIAEARAKRKKEAEQREAAEKDKRIKELEAEIERLKGGG